MLKQLLLTLFITEFGFCRGFFRELTNLDFSPTGKTSGVAASDLDNDGTFEVFVTVLDGPNKIIKYDRTRKRYYDVAKLHPKYNFTRDQRGKTISACSCDMDGDGIEELYLHNINAVYTDDSDIMIVPDKLFKILHGEYIDLFSVNEHVRALAPQYGGNALGCIDRTGSGTYDVIVSAFTKDGKGSYKVFSASQGQLKEISEDIGMNMERDGRGILVGSLFEDNPYSDIFITNDNSYYIGSNVIRHNGRNVLLKNKGDGSFEDVAEKTGVEDVNNNGRGSVMADFNFDGRMDLVFTNWLGPTRLFQQQRNNNINMFLELAASSVTESSAANVLLIGDFDNDGQMEVLKTAANGDAMFPKYNKFFRIVSTQNSTNTEFIDTTWGINDKLKKLQVKGIALADVDNDGILELYISHDRYNNTTFSIFQHEDNNFNWIRVTPLTKHGSFARGSTVILQTDNLETTRRIVGADCSYMCQSEPTAHFGLGNNRAKEVSVIWPDGHIIRKVLYKRDNRKTLVIAYSGKVTYIDTEAQTDTKISYGSLIHIQTCCLTFSFLISFCIIHHTSIPGI